ncbi:MAG TPA: serine/threonine-protein kinase, partial [Verrucomicrobiae bacterium]|nr:serine/threonine-protein kinase [Verrucomicrobiae bacterium]
MPDLKRCGACGAPIPRDAPYGNCPDCLVGVGLDLVLPAQAIAENTPARIGDYELLEPIGRGGMGVVFKARHLSLNRIIALKMLNPHSAAFPKVAERLQLEAEAAASLNHPNIVTIHDVGEHDGRPFFTMEMVEGVGMDKLIGKSGYRPPNFPNRDGDSSREPHAPAVRTLVAIARAVDYAHKHGVLHRDLKPANVVVDHAGTPHLTDFGIAKVLGPERARQTDSGFALGTPAYMAPEQAAGGAKRVSTSADIYSLGAVLYEMLTGCPPFRGETPLDTLRQVSEAEPKSPAVLNPTVDSDLATICLKCLEKVPEHRYPTALALAEELERWLRHEPIEARPVGTFGRFSRWCRREPRLAGMTAGLFVLISATMLLALTLYYREREQLAVANEEKMRRKELLEERIDKEWALGGRNGIRVYASELAMLAERPHSVEGNEIEVVLGVHQPRQAPDPLQILQRFELLVNSLPIREPVESNGRLLFELQIYPTYSNALAGLSNQEAHVMLLTPTSYVRHRRHDPEMQPLAQFSNARQR